MRQDLYVTLVGGTGKYTKIFNRETCREEIVESPRGWCEKTVRTVLAWGQCRCGMACTRSAYCWVPASCVQSNETSYVLVDRKFHVHLKDNWFLKSKCTPCIYFFWPRLPTHCRCRGYCCTWSHTMTHTHWVGLPWTKYRTVSETSTCPTEHLQETDIHAPAGLEPAIPQSERPQTHALDRAVTRIGCPCI